MRGVYDYVFACDVDVFGFDFYPAAALFVVGVAFQFAYVAAVG